MGGTRAAGLLVAAGFAAFMAAEAGAPLIGAAGGIALAAGTTLLAAGARGRGGRTPAAGWPETLDAEWPDVLFEVTAEGRTLDVAGASRAILGWAPEEITGLAASQVTLDPVPFLDAGPTAPDGGRWSARWIHADGSAASHEARVWAIRDAEGRVASVRGVLRDPGEHAETEARLRASEHRLRHALDATREGLALVASDGTLLFVNEALRAMLGYDVAGPARLDQLAAPGRLDLLAGLVASREWTEGSGVFETALRCRDGSVVDVEVALSALRDGQGEAVLVEVRDLAEARRSGEAIRRMADYDRLTGLPGRDLFDRHVRRAIIDARQRDEGVCVILLGLDRFNLVNDALGHASGDRLLKAVAERLQDRLPSPQVVARFSGDEFLVLAPQLPAPESAEGVARRVLQALAEPFLHEGRLLKVAASAGVALFPQHADDPESLIRVADRAIHLVKDKGGDGYRIGAEEETADMRDRLSLEADLREAVAQHAFEVHYQPQVDPTTHELRGMEALLRWRHSERGLVSPVDFIPLLEQTGLIVPVGEWVLEQSCRQMQAWIADGSRAVRLAVNLSPRQLMVPGLERTVRAILERTGLRPELLELELTETTANLTMDAVIEVLHGLHSIGVTTAIDDFGIGHSWLGRLRQFPVQTLKVDRSFIHGMDESAGDRAIVEAVVALGHALGLTVVAEGVESERDLILVREVGCDLVQGYYYSPAVDAATMALMLQGDTAQAA
ncbi:MAG: bifunctional diguanylate cyclase/phosphodiesterase [Dehalococcoidia bacterium]|nr:MAG: bifunctional diguanylate cyclase/phosphodiesterase [Dehalococcoidia bacterium]